MSWELDELTTWSFPDTKYVPDGYDQREVPALTEANFHLLIERHNDLVRAYNSLRKDIREKEDL